MVLSEWHRNYKNLTLAKEWYKKSARLGDIRAMYSLGEIAFYDCDYATAKVWFDRAIAKGHIGSQYMLGKMLWKGCGFLQDQKMGRKSISLAAKRNYPTARRAERLLSRRT